MKRIHYIILTAVLMVLAYCGGQIDTPPPQAQQQPVSAKGPWELHTTSNSAASWRINTQTGKVDLLLSKGATLEIKAIDVPGP
jgi:hypothetical protein